MLGISQGTVSPEIYSLFYQDRQVTDGLNSKHYDFL